MPDFRAKFVDSMILFLGNQRKSSSQISWFQQAVCIICINNKLLEIENLNHTKEDRQNIDKDKQQDDTHKYIEYKS